MRALVCVLSVLMPIWAPVRLIALCAQRVDGHRHQGHAHLLAGREQHVHLAGGGRSVISRGQVDEDVGVVAHRADDHHHLVALLLRANRLARGGEDLLGVGDAGAAEFLNDQAAWSQCRSVCSE